MEDAHATVLDLEDDERNAFFAVYDGHGGLSLILSPRSPIDPIFLSPTLFP